MTRLEPPPRPGSGLPAIGPCLSPETTTPRRHRAPRARLPAPPPLLLCKCNASASANPRAGWRRHVARSFLSLCASLSFLGRHLVLTACWAAEDPPDSGKTFPAPVGTAPPARPLHPLPLPPPGVGRAGRRGSSVPSRPRLPRWAVAGPQAPAVPRGEDGGGGERGLAPGRGVVGSGLGRVGPDSPLGPRCPGRVGLPWLPRDGASIPSRSPGLWGWPGSRPESLLPPPRWRPWPCGDPPGGAGASRCPRSPAGAPSPPLCRFAGTMQMRRGFPPSFRGSPVTYWGRTAKCFPCVGRLEVFFHPLRIFQVFQPLKVPPDPLEVPLD